MPHHSVYRKKRSNISQWRERRPTDKQARPAVDDIRCSLLPFVKTTGKMNRPFLLPWLRGLHAEFQDNPCMACPTYKYHSLWRTYILQTAEGKYILASVPFDLQ